MMRLEKEMKGQKTVVQDFQQICKMKESKTRPCYFIG